MTLPNDPSDKTSAIIGEDQILQISNVIHYVLYMYLQGIRTPGSWAQYYIVKLGIKLIGFSFDESKDMFYKKLSGVLDLIELAHLYCKLTNPKEYSITNHNTHRVNHKLIVKYFKDLTEEQYQALRINLKGIAAFGPN